jgi:putative hemolysin
MSAVLAMNIADHEAVHGIAPRPMGVAAPELSVGLALTAAEKRESQRLRYRIFAEEMGARLDTPEPGLDIDAYDAYCRHIVVRDHATREVVASTRVLLDTDARRAGGFYSQSEFDIERLLNASGRILEIGRTCVHPDYRSGAAISLLWSGLARCIDIRQYQYLIGCASVPMGANGATASAAYELLKEKYLLPEASRVTPKLPLPEQLVSDAKQPKPSLPPLLKAYIRLGARIGGEPCWDPLFDCADLFIVLSPVELQKRYAKHFLGR